MEREAGSMEYAMEIDSPLLQVLNEPDLVFHYTRGVIGLHDIVSGDGLRLSLRGGSSDPQEKNVPSVGVSATAHSEEKLDEFLRIGLDAQSAFLARFAGFESVRQTSFCRNLEPPENSESDLEGRGYARPRMWSQYGEAHRGACLAHSKVALIEYLTRQSSDTQTFHFSDVEYRPFPVFDHLKTSIKGGKVAAMGIEKYVDQLSSAQWRVLLFTKHLDYSAENEFKICVVAHSSDDVFIPTKPNLRAIVLGADFPDTLFPAAIDVGERSQVPVFSMSWSYAQPFVDVLSDRISFGRSVQEQAT